MLETLRRRPARNIVLLAAALAAAVAPLALPAHAAKVPPVIDREQFLGDPEVAGAQISPDGRFVAFIKPFKGTRNIWVKTTDEAFGKARPLTDDTKRPIPAFFWSRDGKFILFVQDQGGDENYNVYAVDPAGKPAEGRDVPAARNLTALKSVRAMIYAVPRAEPDALYVGINDRDPAWHDLYRVSIATGERKLLHKNEDRLTGWLFDSKGQLKMASRTTEKGDTELLTLADGKFTKVYSCTVLEGCGPVRVHKDGQRVYLETNAGNGGDLSRLILFDPKTGKEELVEQDPDKRVDFGGAIFSEVSDELVATSYEDERTRIYFRDKAWEADYRFLEGKLKGKEVNPASTTADEQIWLISASSDTEPGERWLFDRRTKKLTLQYRTREGLKREHLAPMNAIRYPSSDGLSVPAFLTLPVGVEPKNLPLVVFPHGGPWARDGWGFHPYVQLLANRGYAVLQPNFRGSTGYGKKFLDAGNREWGQKMQDDLTWGVKYLVANGTADPRRVAIMGGSYGGYATLAGVTFTPDLYAAAVSIVGPSNLITLLESIPPYWEAIRTVFHARMGNPNVAEEKAQLQRQSPLNSAKNIKTPLLVVQGANDPRVNKAESDQIVIALRDRGFPVEYIVAPDEGHGFARPVNNIAMFTAAEKFLSKHLGGRVQEGASAEVSKRLAEITVDPKTVTMPKKVDAAASTLPKPAADLAPGTFRYVATLEAGPQKIELKTTREIKEENGRWTITDTMTSPMGTAEDRTVVEKGSLIAVSRNVKQGPVTIEMTYADNKASGSVAMGGGPTPVSADLGGPLFADGAGWYDALARLPLAAGYQAVFRNFDLQKTKPQLKQIKVVGTEKVTCAAGTFDAWKAEVTSAENEPGSATLWIARDTRAVVKITATLPQMGGATLTSELQP